MQKTAFFFLAILTSLLFSASWTQASQADFMADELNNSIALATGVRLNISLVWENHSTSPVFDPATKAYYPSVIYDQAKFGGSDAYKMWYSDGTNIMLASSPDGIAWAEFAGNPVAGLTNPHHAQVLYDAGGFGGSGVFYKIWYWDTAQLYSINAIRYAESADGTTWVNDQAITGNIITGVWPDWNRGSYGPVDAFYNPNATNSGTSPFDYSYFMYFDGTTGGVEEVGLAYSADGKAWTIKGKVLPLGAAGDWDSNYVGFGTVVKVNDTDWRFWYSGGQAEMGEGIGYATSTDGISWAKQGQVAELARVSGTWTQKRSYTPSVIYDPAGFSGNGESYVFKMWRTGVDAANNYAIGHTMIPYVSAGNVTSVVFDTAIDSAAWGAITWNADIPQNTSLAFETRTSADNVAWSSWSSATNSSTIASPAGRFIQYRADLLTAEGSRTPLLRGVVIQYSGATESTSETTGSSSLGIEITGECMAEPVEITAEDSGSPVSGVSLRILYNSVLGWEGVEELETGSSGSAEFIPLQDGRYKVRAEKSGYYTETEEFEVERCAECYSDDECKESEKCGSGTCSPVLCDCGEVFRHACVAYECCSSSQCSDQSACESNRCVQVKSEKCGYVANHRWNAYACCSDSDCLENATCVSNACRQLTGVCGYAANHAWNNYTCCSDSDCAGNEACAEHACKPIEGKCGYAENHIWNVYECCADSDCKTGNCVLETHTCAPASTQPNSLVVAALIGDNAMLGVLGGGLLAFLILLLVLSIALYFATREKKGL